MLFGLATSIVTARFLGSAGRGDYFFMVTLAALVVQFANVGLPASNTYFAARNPERTSQLVANAFWISLLAGGGLGFGIALFAHAVGMLQDTPAEFLWLAAALVAATVRTSARSAPGKASRPSASRSSSRGRKRSGARSRARPS